MQYKLNSKANAQKYHTIKRASERFGLYLNDSQLQNFVNFIQANKATLLERQSNRITLWLFAYQGVNIVAAYDSSRKTLATLYPYSWWQERNPNHVNEREIAICNSSTQDSWDCDW